MYAVAQSDNQDLKVNGFDITLSKNNLNLFLILSDIILITIIIIGFNIISYMQRDFSQEYDSNVVEARDFTIVIDQLPQTFR